MILNKFLDKTIEAAKQSARQIYGDDLTALKGILPDKDAGVTFERSNKKLETADREKSTAVESKLTAIREYAARQTASDIHKINGWKGSCNAAALPRKPEQAKSSRTNFASEQVYSRKDIRGTGRTTTSSNGRPEKPSGAGQKESPLHQRLDRLESLVHLTLSSDDLSYASHPAYHKLLHKGVPQRLISDWFHSLSDQGIHPGEQQELFRTKLSHLICEAVAKAKPRPAGQLMFFTGRSGAGKTHLVMKLSQHARFRGDKTLAVASLAPPAGTNRPYYTILAPFCRDHNIPYYQLRTEDGLGAVTEEWEPFDHILIDTPSVETMEAGEFKQLMGFKERLRSIYRSETHYLVNTSVNGMAFRDPMAARLKADHLALTHIDKSDRWGQAVRLLTQTDYRLRFISSGETIPGDLDIFNPERFAKRLLN